MTGRLAWLHALRPADSDAVMLGMLAPRAFEMPAPQCCTALPSFAVSSGLVVYALAVCKHVFCIRASACHAACKQPYPLSMTLTFVCKGAAMCALHVLSYVPNGYL